MHHLQAHARSMTDEESKTELLPLMRGIACRNSLNIAIHRGTICCQLPAFPRADPVHLSISASTSHRKASGSRDRHFALIRTADTPVESFQRTLVQCFERQQLQP